MTVYFFRAEAVNMTPTVYDTSDISTIRGAGFYLLDRIKSLGQNSNYCEELVTEGASAAVFKIETDTPEETRKEMLLFLYSINKKGNTLPEMTFIVEFLECQNDFPTTMAALQGKIRVSQMQSPTIRIFPETLTSSGKSHEGRARTFDALNRVLPAHVTDNSKGELSKFTKNRRLQGIDLRKKIYSDLLKKYDIPANVLNFTEDLETLSKDPGQGNLNGKIAYIYIDGNKFGKLQRSLDERSLKEFDTALDNFKKEFLFRLIEYSRTNSISCFTDPKVNGLIRLETLLWGGDEIKLIVPAWLGWTVATLFFKTVVDLDLKFENKDLTYAMGMVLTHHKNPIRNIDNVAGILVDAIKEEFVTEPMQKAPQYHKQWGNRMHCIVLESLETIPQKNYQAFTKKQYQTPSKDLSFTPETMKSICNLTQAINAAKFSRSRIHKIAKGWLKEKDLEKASEYTLSLQRGLDFCNIDDDQKKDLFNRISDVTGTEINENKISNLIPQRGFRWLQVAELWDYLISKEGQN